MAEQHPPPYPGTEPAEKTRLAGGGGGGGLSSASPPDAQEASSGAYPPPYPTSTAYPPSLSALGHPAAQQAPPAGTTYTGYTVSVPPPSLTQSVRPTVTEQTGTFGLEPLNYFGVDHPIKFQCPYCGNVVTTRTRRKRNNTTLVMLLLAFLFLGCFALICVCFPILHDVEHVCPVDGKVVGICKATKIC